MSERKTGDEFHRERGRRNLPGKAAPTDSSPRDRPPVRVLVAEDYQVIRQALERLLQNAGCMVHLVKDGKQAVCAFEQACYDFVLMDVEMPVMNGFEAARSIRELETSVGRSEGPLGPRGMARVPIIALSGHHLEAHADDFKKAGMDDWLCKPVLRDDLVRMIEKWVPYPGAVTSGSPHVPHEPSKGKTGEDDTPIDLPRALEEFLGDMDFFMEISRGFLDRLRAQLMMTHRALRDGDARLVEKHAHAIKGRAANLTAHALAAAASQLEIVAASGDLEGGIEVFTRLEKETALLEAFLERVANFQ